jgi:predicted transglutaminase-like cysteine proteinase
MYRVIFKKVWKLFQYVPDEVNYDSLEHWTSHAESVQRGERFEDDCDGFALTCAELLIDANLGRELVSVIYCTVPGGGHLVCGYDDGDTTMILDNRYSKPYDYKDRYDYEWKYIMHFDNPGEWDKIKGEE